MEYKMAAVTDQPYYYSSNLLQPPASGLGMNGLVLARCCQPRTRIVRYRQPSRSRTSFTSDRGSPWSNTFHVQQQAVRPDDDGGFLNNSGSQRGSFSVKRDSMASRDQMQGGLTNHVSNRDLTATPSSAVTANSTANSLPRSAHPNMDTPSYTPRSYTPRAEPVTSLLRNHNNSSLSRTHSTKLDGAPMPRSHNSMDALGRGQAVAEHQSSSLPRVSAAVMMNGGNAAPVISSNGYKAPAILPSQGSKYEYTDLPNDNGFLDNHSLVTIHMQPDEQGRFGFNVKGGVDQGMPIIVSRVAPGMPSDTCIPRLNEGDQVLYINGRDVTQHKHEQVVMFIRAARETHSGELVLVVRPNVYVGEDYKEPEFHYIPETRRITAGLDLLSESLMLLREGVDGNAAILQFEQLYRRKPGMTNQCAKAAENLSKNRYRDISPYDQTRVLLRNLPSGDYINANYVNMEIPGSGMVNRYIAAQGPLPNTCADFWELVWQQQITLVVMLTALVERGRIKCHQYWPHLYETTDFGTLQLTCLKEKETRSFAFREFTLVNMETNEERHIYQMQYIAWPDHGVPEDSSDFLDFVIRVRQKRIGMVEPTLVHCSAGIGRTGVLILMETAMCLIESNQPVYPLDVVRQMRDQRAMLIQTSGQYKFVCEAILRVYHEGYVKPLDDFRN
ncbi:tyrosine-protein phosphatase non-receptor type 4-like isoform X2 [Watersipora subatra]|uniref:tyrosine-protein phosphatase non-receptor type 4-like isoform X2 n=1 Tax=Watersipora subatra TaxID=2589382 RepID=UPI00355C51CE